MKHQLKNQSDLCETLIDNQSPPEPSIQQEHHLISEFNMCVDHYSTAERSKKSHYQVKMSKIK